ncbi:MAG: hypothetical protein JWP29_786 [Rhodoferax sp.]|nr:hypothetical protein [Rhodoferax sp.]
MTDSAQSVTSSKMHSDFRHEVRKLRTWLANNRYVDDYDFWWPDQGVVGTFQRFVGSVRVQDWTEEDVTDLLYVLENSSTGYLVELLAENEAMTIAIATHSLARGGLASDDIAEQLAYCDQQCEEAEALLIQFAQHPHERTRRMALLSLARLQSAAVPMLAITAWNTGDEFQRIGALSALDTISSDLFSSYLSQVHLDGRAHLVAYARKWGATAGKK